MKKNSLIILLGAILLFASCKKEKVYVYEVKNVTIKKGGTSKPNVKTTTEFISIAYSDLFGTSISNAELVKLSTAYSSFGDKKLIEDMIIKNYLNSSNPKVQIPTKSEMSANIPKFVGDCYRKFFNRDGNEYEKWFVGNLISTDSNITPELVYYAFLTSNEYRYY